MRPFLGLFLLAPALLVSGAGILPAAEKVDPKAEMLLATLKKEVGAGSRWTVVRPTAQGLVELGDVRAYPLIEIYTERPGLISGLYLHEVLQALRKLDPKRTLPTAELFLENEFVKARIESALVFIDTGQKKKGFVALGEAFSYLAENTANDRGDLRGPELDPLVTMLKADDSQDAWDALARLFDGFQTFGIDWFNHFDLARLLAERGNPVGLKWYGKLLEIRGEEIPDVLGYGAGSVVAHNVADQLVHAFRQDQTVRKISRETAKRSEPRSKAVQKWMAAWIADVEKNW